MRLGVFGGTFDPVHIGHLVAAVNVRHALALDRVMLVVANEPWQKAARAITPAEDRFGVLAASVSGLEGLEASRIEIDRGGVSYTVDTITQLRRVHPGDELYLVVGEDVARGLATWDRAGELRQMVRLAVVTRGSPLAPLSPDGARGTPGSPDSSVATPGADGMPDGWSGVTVAIPNLDISSTEIRERAAAGQPIDLLVPAGGMAQILARGLYSCNR